MTTPHPAPDDTVYTPAPTPPRLPWAGSNRRHELPPDWHRRRARVLRRDQYACRTCGAPATDVDHINDRNDHNETNLQALCSVCHGIKTRAEAAAARAANPPPPLWRPKPPHPGLVT